MKHPIKMTPGDDLHLTLLMAPHSLNLAVGQFRDQLLGYGRAAFEAGKAGQAAPVAVGEREAFEAWMSEGGKWPSAIEREGNGEYKLMQAASAWNVWQARATLAATPADCQRPECISRGCFGHCQKGRK